ncbi:MAG: ABC transporter permease [Actinomycetota bacterium]
MFFLAPIVLVGMYSVGGLTLYRNDVYLTLDAWSRFLDGSVYLALFWKSVRMALTVSVLAVLLAYPVAYYLALCTKGRKYVLLLFIITPFLTSYLLRLLAWRVILGSHGVVNSFLLWSGMRRAPVEWLLHSPFAVILVLTYVWVPFVCLPIFVTLDTMDRSLLEAAGDLGASRWRTFWRVTFRMSTPGVLAAFAFVFIPTIGEFVTPLLVGGPKGFMFGNAIADLFGPGFDWQTGSVLGVFLLLVVGVVIGIFARSMRLSEVTSR